VDFDKGILGTVLCGGNATQGAIGDAQNRLVMTFD